MKRDRDELLSVHADDPAELSVAEAAEVADRLARDPAARAEVAETRAVLARLRDLPAEGQEPAWPGFAVRLREAIAEAEAARARGWLRRFWKPLVGLTLGATAAAAILLGGQGAGPPREPVALPERRPDAGATTGDPRPDRPAEPEPAALPLAFGPEAQLDDDQLDGVLIALADHLDDELGTPDDGMLPDLTLDWVDDLDDEDLDAVDAWLASLEDET